MATNGIVLIRPTSTAIAGAGSSATINTNGSVTFTACTSISLNGVFSSVYDNYLVNIISHDATSSGVSLLMRMRLSGIDNQTASSYVRQNLTGSGAGVLVNRTTTTSAEVFVYGKNALRNGLELFVYGPFLTQPTAVRGVSTSSEQSAYLYESVFTHNQAVSYDGFTLFTGASGVTGLIKVYGLVK